MAVYFARKSFAGWILSIKIWLVYWIVISLLNLHQAQSDDRLEYDNTLIRTSETINISRTKFRYDQTAIQPEATPAPVPEDQLPLVYWVETKPKLYWPSRNIFVFIDHGFDSAQSQTIWLALGELSKSLADCITFSPNQSPDQQTDYLHFKKSKVCDSRIGYRGGPHTIKLSNGCLYEDELGAVQHEVLHALGFFHEHSRLDRDDYVEVYWDNVISRDKKNFNVLKFDTFELPYDYTSVMHYASDAYAINEAIPTLTPTNPSVNITSMGQRIGLSEADVKRVRMPYKCDMSTEDYKKVYDDDETNDDSNDNEMQEQ